MFSLRINKRNTTISIKNKVLAFYCTIVHLKKTNIHDFLQEKINEFASEYEKDNFKGLSDYITDKILTDMLRKKERKQYREHLSRLEE